MTNSLLARLCIGAAATLAAAGVHAQEFPTKPLRLIVAFGPGGVADVTARIVAEGLSQKFGKPVIVENMPSAGGITAAVALTRSAPDGHTLFIVSNQNAVSPSLFKSLPYDPLKQFAMISMVGSFDIVMAVDQNSPLRTVADAVAAAKKDPQHFNMGTIGVGSTQHLSAELFRSLADIKVPTVPFKSSGEVLAAVKGNSVQVMFETVPAVIGNIKGGSLRLLGVGSEKRSALFPDVPTIAETVPGYSAVSWNGFAAPAGTPPAVVDKLNKAIREVVADPAINKKLVDVGMIPQTNTPKEFHALLVSEIDKWRKVIDTAGIEKQ
ncbi:Tripartite tricarboxylate transporter family receptor [Pigmentiphaga humi]|uniref:Tripartite tricarboxylate transporter family receptor n=1 Tax=Pigmentiphaga humi TaxID=2478468 RepID=A0A3P4BAL7_9BURK|nr:tripartite tricarboxylate transporter substrate binding protein [Pigmentiphaga humi]VCU72165.1 Tripartite tricarboxylate transporter family receptor [Pigmentiphaga humi]